MEFKQFVTELAPKLSTGFNTLSLISSIIAVLLFIFVAYNKPNMMNRVTLRLQADISFFDMLNHLFNLFHHLKDVPHSFCQFIGFYRSFGTMIYCFLNVCIALNLQLIFLHNLTPNRNWEIGYWIVALGLTLIANIIPLGLPYTDTVTAVNINGMSIVAFLYCLLVSVLVLLKLVKNMKDLDTTTTNLSTTMNGPNSKLNMKNQLKKLALRISIYPVLCFISLLGFNIRFFVRIYGGNINTIGLVTLSLVGLTTAGFFNLIALCLDPTFQKATLTVFRKKFNKKENDVEKADDIYNGNNEIVIAKSDNMSNTVEGDDNLMDESNYNQLAKFL